jgi:hypothetical protein
VFNAIVYREQRRHPRLVALDDDISLFELLNVFFVTNASSMRITDRLDVCEHISEGSASRP